MILKKTVPLFILLASLFHAYGALSYHLLLTEYEVLHYTVGKNSYDIQGIIEDIKTSDSRFKHAIILRITQANGPGSDLLLHKKIMIYLPEMRSLFIGDTIRFDQVTFKQHYNKSYIQYLMKENIAATLFMTSFNPLLIHRPALCFSRWLAWHKQRIVKSVRNNCSVAASYMVTSIFLGSRFVKKETANSLKNRCAYWGISHYLARSGLHLVIFMALWTFLFRFLPGPFIFKQFLLLLMGLGYNLISWESVSFSRSFLVFILYKICIIFSKPPNFLHLLTLVCLIMILMNPLILFFLDFQLSFGITFALAWYGFVQKQANRKILIRPSVMA